MYYYTCKAVLTYILYKFYQTQPIQLGINGNALILPDSTDSTRIFDKDVCKADNWSHTSGDKVGKVLNFNGLKGYKSNFGHFWFEICRYFVISV